MQLHHPHRLTVTLILLAWHIALGATQSVTNPLTLCSSQNTGAGGDKEKFEIYNSVGFCSQFCQGYSFAILQDRQCWCSNTAPNDTVSREECSQNCPGFPTDKCGNSDKGLFGYIQLAMASSTLMASTQPKTTISNANDASTDSSAEKTVTVTAASSRSANISADTHLTSGFPNTGTNSTSHTLPEPNSSLRNSESASATASSTSKSGIKTSKGRKSFWERKGAVAGTFFVVGLVILILLVLLIFLGWRAFQKTQLERVDSTGTPPYTSDSKKGVHAFTPFAMGGSASTGHKRIHSSVSGYAESDVNLVPIFDQRVDPNQFYMHWKNEGSRASLQDHEDYSRRVLRVTNPE